MSRWICWKDIFDLSWCTKKNLKKKQIFVVACWANKILEECEKGKIKATLFTFVGTSFLLPLWQVVAFLTMNLFIMQAYVCFATLMDLHTMRFFEWEPLSGSLWIVFLHPTVFKKWSKKVLVVFYQYCRFVITGWWWQKGLLMLSYC